MKRHNNDEIAAKLRLANELAAKGYNQAQICKELSVSVMTFHRWRKHQGHTPSSMNMTLQNDFGSGDILPVDTDRSVPAYSSSVQELIIENRRLKKIVTDLLLEKMKLEEAHLSRSKRETRPLVSSVVSK